MQLTMQKRVAARLLKVGLSRVRVVQDKQVDEALTREDIRQLIGKGLIYAVQKKGTSRADANVRLRQKKKGLRKGIGSRKGRKGARTKTKRVWIRQVRGMRSLLASLRDDKMIEKADYKKIYYMVKGNAFRNKAHLLFYLKENEYLAEKAARKAK
ncbi:MAG: 50S ribosomal protein L19e [Candidatus Aenigmarchaeota archaeon]|nr:50S ribosomal protein L19e [Candidatus Aenigmarchaeota archaeon]